MERPSKSRHDQLIFLLQGSENNPRNHLAGKSRHGQLIFLLAFLLLGGEAFAGVITKLPAGENAIALTFDACETRTPSYFDRSILDYLIRERIPCTLFVSGKFAKRNAADLAELSKLDFMEIENHSMNHLQHMEKLEKEEIEREVTECEDLIESVIGRRTSFFRFPAGNYDEKALRTVEALGYKVVHWTFASGDPDKNITADELAKWVLGKAAKGDILIFHINGRGWHSGEVLPGIVENLKKKGLRFVRLDEFLLPPANLEKKPESQR